MMRALLKAGTILAAMTIFPSAVQAASFPFQTSEPAQLLGAPGVTVTPLFTVGETLGSYRPVGILDGIGALKVDRNTVRVFVNSEITPTQGYAYSLDNGAGGSVALTGARVHFFDIDINTRNIKDAGLAYNRIFDRAGNIVSNAAQVNNGLNRLCSSAAFVGNTYGAGRGVVDSIYLAGEETGNGTMFVLDPATRTMHAAPALGRGAWENATQIDTGTTDKVAFILSDDSNGYPLYLYVGEKDAKGDGSFLDKNGLAQGKTYVWKANSGDLNASTFNGSAGAPDRDGTWVEIETFNAAKAGTPGYDALGYADQSTQLANAAAVGAFQFSRPEDVATNPSDHTLVALASTGSGFAGGADTWGTVYTIDTDFDASGNPVSAKVKIAYDGNADPNRTLRSPDNLDWAGDNELLIQEDRATDWASALGVNPNEAGIISLTLDGALSTFARIDRSAVPAGQIDGAIGDIGNWESSGILDVSELFGLAAGTLFLADVQAHGINLGSGDLVQGGQLVFLERALAAVPEPASWAMMIAGFGLVGGALRRRVRTLKTVSA